MKTYILSTALALVLATSAQATGNNGNNGNNGNGPPTNVDQSQDQGQHQGQGQAQGQAQGQLQGQGQQQAAVAQQGQSLVNAPVTVARGGAGGQGGSAVGTGIGHGGDASATGGRSESDATATLGSFNRFGGEGGAAYSGSLSDSKSISGALSESLSGASSGSSSSADHSGDTTAAAAASTGAISNTNSTGASTSSSSSAGQTATYTDNSVYEAQKRAPVSSAYAAPLQIGGGVCAYTPVSAAGQFVSFGVSGSAAKIDKGCETRATADMFARMGLAYEACWIMVSQPAAVDAGLNKSVCDRLIPVAAPVAAAVVAPPKPAVTMAPVPNPVPVNDGERGR